MDAYPSPEDGELDLEPFLLLGSGREARLEEVCALALFL